MKIDTEKLIEIPAPEPHSWKGCVFAINENGGHEEICNTQMCGDNGTIFVEKPVAKQNPPTTTIALIPAIEPDSCKGCVFASGHKCVKPKNIKLTCWQADAIFIRCLYRTGEIYDEN